jgi:hypothetical protein
VEDSHVQRLRSRLILVEGESDRIALEALARKLGLERPDIAVLGGAHAVASFVAITGKANLVGLCDKNEEFLFRRVLDRVHVCDPDLEGELIRALGAERVLQMVEPSFATLQKQPAWRGMPLEDQLRRYLSGRSGNKLRYASLFVEALDLDRVPRPLHDALRPA